jgi:hypothetical protein
MKARSTRLTLEALDDRSLPSTVAHGDFNHDGREDMAAITGPTTIVVSLANADGTYTVSAVLAGRANRHSSTSMRWTSTATATST